MAVIKKLRMKRRGWFISDITKTLQFKGAFFSSCKTDQNAPVGLADEEKIAHHNILH